MELIPEPEKSGGEIKRCISQFGYKPEHNYTYFLTTAESGAKNIFLRSSKGYGVLAAYKEKAAEVTMISEALAPRDEQAEVLHDALDTCFSKLNVQKFVVEQDDALRQKTLKEFANNGYRALPPRYSLYWPLFDMAKWGGNDMPGEDWKKLRNIRNRFFNEHSVEVVDSKSVDKEKLKKIINEWVERRKLMSLGANRKDSNLAYYERYVSMIDLGFEGTKFAKTMVVDGEPCTLTAGWEIPNSDGAYYSAIGISNYGFEGLSEIANLDDLHRLKENGYSTVDFGGSPMPLLKFKLKFRPHAVYVTHTYAIVKK
ncbi:DUF2156 domain-containing protein [Candidatus Woesearchaeota archaeon]|nr:DUF2156 domain-containing protein [Candidatus Woesearchaeota archaeon]